RDFLSQLPPVGLMETVVYKNTKGEPWTSTVEDIVTHVLLHSAYHRGQIATLVRASGEQPAYTDFIHAVRQGLVE
ncbi:MAG: DinB family protein, partial [Candidatus Sulfotelmatobacter sp.]